MMLTKVPTSPQHGVVLDPRSYTLEVEKVFKVGRHGEDEVFEKVGGKLDNHMLLWHGACPRIMRVGCHRTARRCTHSFHVAWRRLAPYELCWHSEPR